MSSCISTGEDGCPFRAAWARLDVWTGALHAFDLYGNDYERAARNRMHEFLITVPDEG